jgi:hypothetical protein
MGTDGHLYGAVADLPVRVESVALTGRSTATSYGFRRPTTVVHLRGAGHEGRGGDVTTNQPDHERFQSRGVGADLTGSYTLATFSERVGTLDLAVLVGHLDHPRVEVAVDVRAEHGLCSNAPHKGPRVPYSRSRTRG